MATIRERLEQATTLLREVLTEVDASGLDEHAPALFAVAGDVERAGRAVDALRIAVAATVGDQSRPILGSESLARRSGCGNAVELLERLTLISRTEARRRLRLGAATQRGTRLLTGEALPARFDAVRAALAAGR
ncbi:hypothetical protein WDJ51_13015, partial [Rathayibacter sp. YIM 133350]